MNGGAAEREPRRAPKARGPKGPVGSTPTASARLYNRKVIRSIRVAVSRTETLNARGGEWQVGAERRGPR